MTIASTANRNDYTGNGSTATYAYSFRIDLQTDLLVTVRDDSTGVETTMSIATDYTVTGVGNSSGGNVVLVQQTPSQAWLDGSGFLDTGYILTIRRVVPLTQGTDIRNQGTFYPEVHEDALDKLVMIDQQQQDEVDRSIKLPETVAASGFSTELPSNIADLAGGVVAVNADGDGLTVSTATLPTATVTAFAETLLDDATAIEARTTLGFAGTGGTVQAANIEADAVETAKIKDSNVTLGKLAAAVQALLVPTGTVNAYGGSSAPTGWLLCDGSAVSRTTYAALFAVVGTAYGAGDTTTTFNVPDFREAAPVGAGTRGSGVTAHDAYTVGEFKDDQMQGHWHSTTFTLWGDAGGILSAQASGAIQMNNTNTVGSPTDDGTNGTPRTGTVTRGKRLGVNFIIKT